jgi:hypothetical protein
MSITRPRNMLAIAIHMLLGAGVAAAAAAAETDNSSTPPAIGDASKSTTTTATSTNTSANPGPVRDSAAGHDKQVTELGKINVEETVSPLKVEQVSSSKYTEPLRNQRVGDPDLGTVGYGPTTRHGSTPRQAMRRRPPCTTAPRSRVSSFTT